MVKIISGKDRGKTGKVLKVDTKKNRVWVVQLEDMLISAI